MRRKILHIFRVCLIRRNLSSVTPAGLTIKLNYCLKPTVWFSNITGTLQKYSTCWNTWKEMLIQKKLHKTDEHQESIMMRQTRQTVIERKKKRVIYALQVSARSGSARPSGFAGRPLVCVWAASYHQSLLPGGRCSLLATCRPPPPAGRAAPLIPYLRQRKHTESREQCLNITSVEGSAGGHSVIHQYWYNVNINCILPGKSNIVSCGRSRHFSPFYPSVSCSRALQFGCVAF